MIKAVFLDIDDTLLDFQAYVIHSMKTGFDKFGIGTYTDEMYPVFTKINTGLWQAHERGELSFEDIKRDRWNLVFAALGLKGDGTAFEDFFRDELFNNAIPVEGAYEILEYLSGKYLVCTASNGPFAQQMNRLAISNMQKYFDFFFISERMGIQKPDPAFGEKALAELKAAGKDIDPCEIMIIGDSMSSDMTLGKNCGMKTCLFDPRGRYAQPGTDCVINSLLQLKDIL